MFSISVGVSDVVLVTSFPLRFLVALDVSISLVVDARTTALWLFSLAIGSITFGFSLNDLIYIYIYIHAIYNYILYKYIDIDRYS